MYFCIRLVTLNRHLKPHHYFVKPIYIYTNLSEWYFLLWGRGGELLFDYLPQWDSRNHMPQ